MANKHTGHKQVAAVLRALRAARSWDQDLLATKTGLTRRKISSYENEEATPPLDAAKALADAFGVTLDTFFAGTVHLSEQEHPTQ